MYGIVACSALHQVFIKSGTIALAERDEESEDGLLRTTLYVFSLKPEFLAVDLLVANN